MTLKRVMPINPDLSLWQAPIRREAIPRMASFFRIRGPASAITAVGFCSRRLGLAAEKFEIVDNWHSYVDNLYLLWTNIRQRRGQAVDGTGIASTHLGISRGLRCSQFCGWGTWG